MHFWSGVSAIAGALRRKVWLDMKSFKWHVNHYVIIVAPPGVVSKSTTSGISMNLLRQVDGIKFGPEVVTWPALVTAFAQSHEMFMWPQDSGDMYGQCALTLESSEFGNLINPQDREMIDLLVTLWDAKTGGFSKVTKKDGKETVENPWINLIACTTPAWIAGNFPEYVIGGGFTSRCLFVYCEEKFKELAYPDEVAPPDYDNIQKKLVEDLNHIYNNLCGPYKLHPLAREWGKEWYHTHRVKPPEILRDSRFGGYLARKQTHLHKLAMILAAARRDELIIMPDDLQVASKMISDLEADMPKVFSKIGRSEESIQAERLLDFIRRSGEISYVDAYRYVHLHFPQLKDFEGILYGAIRAGYIQQKAVGTLVTLKWVAKD